MALTKPFINTISAFDAQNGITININVLGGDAITAYSFNIIKSDGSLLFTPSQKINVNNDIADGTIRTFPITINKNMGIENNQSYMVEPITYNFDTPNGQKGQATNFTCYPTPYVDIYYYDIQNGQAGYFPFVDNSVVGTSTPNIKIQFNPNDLNSVAEPNVANVYVYGINGSARNLIYSSEDIYNFTYDINTNLYEISTDLADFTININEDGSPSTDRLYNSFEVEWMLRTIENFQPTLQGLITGINCYYPILYNSPYLVINNLCQEGKIEINSSLTSYEGTSNPYPPVYIDNKEADLTQNGSWVQWSKYFVLKQPYTFRLWGRNFNVGQIADLSYSSDSSRHIILKYNQEDIYDETTQTMINYTFVSLASGQSKMINNIEYFYPYYIESERIPTNTITATTKLFINVQEQGELFDISFKILN